MRTYPLNVVGPDKRPGMLLIEVYDEEAWRTTRAEKKYELYDTAMMYGKIEYHRQMPIAMITRQGQARL